MSRRVSRIRRKLAIKRREEAVRKHKHLQKQHESLKTKHALETHRLLRGREHAYIPAHQVGRHMRTPSIVWGLIIILVLMGILFLLFVR